MKNESLIWWGLGLGLIFLGGAGEVAVLSSARGIRNNNPGNIEYDGTDWLGLANPPSDGTFFVFTAPVYGIRALARVLQNYIALDGVLSTVSDIITRFAPPPVNDTASYIADVDSRLGLSPENDAIDLGVSLQPLMAAIISHENGSNPYSSSDLAQGIAMAA
jgi:hypothetical protein